MEKFLDREQPFPEFFLRRFEEPKRSPKIVQRYLKICFYNIGLVTLAEKTSRKKISWYPSRYLLKTFLQIDF